MAHELTLLPDTLAICRLPAEADVPTWAQEKEDCCWTVVRTAEELTVVCGADRVPEVTRASRGWRALRVEGPIDLGSTGVLTALAAPLAEAEVPLFAISTYDTDYLLVPEDGVDPAIAALEGQGHGVGR
jgi:hypothetical protein